MATTVRATHLDAGQELAKAAASVRDIRISSLAATIAQERDKHLAECPPCGSMEVHLARAIHDAGWRPT